MGARWRGKIRKSEDEIGLGAVELALYSAAAPADSGARVDPNRAIELRASESPEGASVLLLGRDPGAPRALWLWRIEADGAALHARGASREDGSLAFPPAILPRAGLELIATPAGASPGGREASQALRVEGRPPRAPAAEFVVGASSEWLLRVTPREPSADIALGDAAGRELARFPVRGFRARREFEIDLDDFPGGAPAKVAHVLPNGLRSEWRNIEAWTFHNELE